MWTPGLGELLIIFAIVLVLFGGGKLAGVANPRTAISEFKSALSDERKRQRTPRPRNLPRPDPPVPTIVVRVKGPSALHLGKGGYRCVSRHPHRVVNF